MILNTYNRRYGTMGIKTHKSTDGIWRRCTAKGSCPLGGEENHKTYDNIRDLAAANQSVIDSQGEEEYGFLPTVSSHQEIKNHIYKNVRVEVSLRSKIESVSKGDRVYVEYDGKSFEGEVESIYKDHDGIIMTDDDGGYKHIKTNRITDINVAQSESQPTLTHKIKSIAINDAVRFEYDGKTFQGEVAGIYKEHDGLIVSDENGEFKHIKTSRITDINVIQPQPKLTLPQKIKSVEVNDDVRVEYENGQKEFEGKVHEIFKEHNGLIISNEDGDFKHIKADRITDIKVTKNKHEEE